MRDAAITTSGDPEPLPERLVGLPALVVAPVVAVGSVVECFEGGAVVRHGALPAADRRSTQDEHTYEPVPARVRRSSEQVLCKNRPAKTILRLCHRVPPRVPPHRDQKPPDVAGPDRARTRAPISVANVGRAGTEVREACTSKDLPFLMLCVPRRRRPGNRPGRSGTTTGGRVRSRTPAQSSNPATLAGWSCSICRMARSCYRIRPIYAPPGRFSRTDRAGRIGGRQGRRRRVR